MREGQRKAVVLADLVVAAHSPQFSRSALLKKNLKTKFHYDSLAIVASVLKISVLVWTISKELIYLYLFLVYVVFY